MKTYIAKKDQLNANWKLVDASGQTLGRLSTRVASLLSGKTKVDYSPHHDNGDFVVIVNASSIVLTGNKLADKIYYRHSGYTGHLREVTAGQLLEKHPERVIEHAVRGMLPKNKLGRKMLKKLKVYAGADHPHQSQQPEAISL